MCNGDECAITNSHFLIFGSQLLGLRLAGTEIFFSLLIFPLQCIKLGLCYDPKMSSYRQVYIANRLSDVTIVMTI